MSKYEVSCRVSKIACWDPIMNFDTAIGADWFVRNLNPNEDNVLIKKGKPREIIDVASLHTDAIEEQTSNHHTYSGEGHQNN